MNELPESTGKASGKRVLLHIGMHKTGTTAIQYHLAYRRNELEALGLRYPIDLPEGTPYSEAHHYIPFFLMGLESYNDTLGYPKDYAKGLRERIEADRSGCILFSSENFDCLKPEEVASLGRILDGFDVRVIVYLRRQDEFCQAMYQTDIVNVYFPSMGPIDSYELKSSIDYWELLGRWAAVFGKENLIVRVYEEGQLQGGEAVGDFLHVLAGLGYSLGESQSTAGLINFSLPSHYVETVRKVALKSSDMKTLWGAARKAGRKLYRGKSPNLWFMSPSQRRALLDRYNDSNRKVALEYLDRRGGKLFNDLTVPSNDEEWALFHRNESALFARVLDDFSDRIDGLEKENAELERQLQLKLREYNDLIELHRQLELKVRVYGGKAKLVDDARKAVLRIPWIGRLLLKMMRGLLQ